MLKIVKMMSLYFLAATVCEQTTMSIPPELLRPNAPIYYVMVSAYANHPKCTGSTRGITSSSLRITPQDHGKIIALSKDLASQHRFGDRFNLWVKGKLHEVSYHDSMPNHRRKSVDLLLPSIPSCIQFGRNPGVLVPLDQT
jgi:3D (Asp-Asp-Asp) domain-containing protein